MAKDPKKEAPTARNFPGKWNTDFDQYACTDKIAIPVRRATEEVWERGRKKAIPKNAVQYRDWFELGRIPVPIASGAQFDRSLAKVYAGTTGAKTFTFPSTAREAR